MNETRVILEADRKRQREELRRIWKEIEEMQRRDREVREKYGLDEPMGADLHDAHVLCFYERPQRWMEPCLVPGVHI